ncbi:hypothetical protein ES705_39176 [subsurface metagenome]
MANLQIKGIDDSLYAQIKDLALSENRSISQEVLFLIKSYMANKKQLLTIKTPAQVSALKGTLLFKRIEGLKLTNWTDSFIRK